MNLLAFYSHKPGIGSKVIAVRCKKWCHAAHKSALICVVSCSIIKVLTVFQIFR